MSEPTRFDRITFDPQIIGGQACIRRMRITVATIVDLIDDGASVEEILENHLGLEEEDIRQALAYAAALVREDVLPA